MRVKTFLSPDLFTPSPLTAHPIVPSPFSTLSPLCPPPTPLFIPLSHQPPDPNRSFQYAPSSSPFQPLGPDSRARTDTARLRLLSITRCTSPADPLPISPLWRRPSPHLCPACVAPHPLAPSCPARFSRHQGPLPSTSSTEPVAWPTASVSVTRVARGRGSRRRAPSQALGAAHEATHGCTEQPPRGCSGTAATPAPVAYALADSLDSRDSHAPLRPGSAPSSPFPSRPALPCPPPCIFTPVPPANSPSHLLAVRSSPPLPPLTSSVYRVVLPFAIIDVTIGILEDACPTHTQCPPFSLGYFSVPRYCLTCSDRSLASPNAPCPFFLPSLHSPS